MRVLRILPCRSTRKLPRSNRRRRPSTRRDDGDIPPRQRLAVHPTNRRRAGRGRPALRPKACFRLHLRGQARHAEAPQRRHRRAHPPRREERMSGNGRHRLGLHVDSCLVAAAHAGGGHDGSSVRRRGCGQGERVSVAGVSGRCHFGDVSRAELSGGDVG